MKFAILFWTSLLVLAATYFYTLINTKFNHTTAIGSKQAFPNCQVKAKNGIFTNETIEIHTVDHGIKIVEAETHLGAMYGLGFIHGMDRLWQLDFMRRLSQGRLSEVFGSETLQLDKYVRTVGIPQMVEKYLTQVDEPNRLILENYAAGINKVVEQIQVYPLEFYIFWHEFEPFTPRDSAAIQYVLTLFISSDWFYEIVRERLLEVYTKDQVDKILPYNRDNLFQFENEHTITDDELDRIGLLDLGSKIYEMPEDLLHKPHLQLKDQIKFNNKGAKNNKNDFKYAATVNGQGSNCWAVHGNHTQSGKPYLSCDPHLQKTIHSIWYMTRLRWNVTDIETGETYRTYLAGASLLGSPVMTHGRSPIVAWGLTAINPDVSDLFVEYFREDHYLTSEQTWAAFETRTETIKVRFGSDYELETRHTRNGVVIPSDFIDGSAHDLMPWISKDVFDNDFVNGTSVAYALCNVYDPRISNKFEWNYPDFYFDLIYKLSSEKKSLTSEELVQTIRENYKVPTNFVFAIVSSGDIGYVTTGKFPIRKHKVVQGSYTKIGFKNDNLWTGFVPSEELPYVINPTKGYVVSANNFITSANAKHGISHSFVFQHRAARISEMIEERIAGGSKVNLKHMKEIQLDVTDIQARESLPDMIKCAKVGAKGRDLSTAFAIFEKWDFKFTVDSSAANLFNSWEIQMSNYLHETTIDSKELRNSLQNHPAYLSGFYAQLRLWAQKSETVDAKCFVYELNSTNTCQEFMAFTLQKAFEDLTYRLGKYDRTKNNWRFGAVQFVRYLHSPLSQIPVIRHFFEHTTEYPGNKRTNNVAVSFRNVPKNIEDQVLAGSVFRMISDLADEGQIQIVMDVGPETTNPWTSDHRLSINNPWNLGHFIRLPLQEMTDQIRYKMAETAPPRYLFPDDKGVVKEKKKGGCPLGFTKDSPFAPPTFEPSKNEENNK